MIVIIPLDGKPIEHFEDYNELFEHLTAIDNTKLVAKNSNFKEMNWSLTVHPPRRVTAFYAHLKDSCEAIKEAYEEGLSLIAICTGDYRTPTYIALTPNVDLAHLKKQWCIDYCTWHDLMVREV
jgi:hypothetical protein